MTGTTQQLKHFEETQILSLWEELWELAEREINYNTGTIDKEAFIEYGMKKFQISLRNVEMNTHF